MCFYECVFLDEYGINAFESSMELYDAEVNSNELCLKLKN